MDIKLKSTPTFHIRGGGGGWLSRYTWGRGFNSKWYLGDTIGDAAVYRVNEGAKRPQFNVIGIVDQRLIRDLPVFRLV